MARVIATQVRKDRVRAVQMHLYLLVVDDFNMVQDAPHGSASQTGTAARLLFPGFEAELDILSGQWLAVMELYGS